MFLYKFERKMKRMHQKSKSDTSVTFLSLSQVATQAKTEEDGQLIKCKETGLNLQFYISRDHDKHIKNIEC